MVPRGGQINRLKRKIRHMYRDLTVIEVRSPSGKKVIRYDEWPRLSNAKLDYVIGKLD